MGVKYDGLKLVWLKQYGSNESFITWVSPDAGDVGSFVGGAQTFIRSQVRVINGPAPAFSLISGSMPAGLNLDPNTGMVSGVLENEASSYEYTLRAQSGNAHVERTFSANVSVNLAPVWTTPAGSLGEAFDNTPVELQLEAEDPEGEPVIFSLVAGSLPLGLRMSNTGVISGLLSTVTDDTTFFFTLAASDGVLSTQRAFNYTTKLNVAPIWNTPGGQLGTPVEGFPFSYQLDATGVRPITYTIASGGLPNGLTMDANTGLISGDLTAVATDTQSNFTIRASDGIKATNRSFGIYVMKNKPPQWVSAGQVAQNFGGKFINFSLSAYDPNGQPITYVLANGSTLPGDLELTSEGIIAGTLPAVEATQNFAFSAIASDGLLTSQRAFTINVLKNEAPVWDTANTLTAVLEETSFVRYIQAHDPAGVQTITYSLESGSLPNGVSLESNGRIFGTPDSVFADTDYSFTATANNGVLTSDRTFTLMVNKNVSPIWTTNSGLINSIQGLYNYDYNLSGYDPNNTDPVFTLASGSLPGGVTLSMAGRLSGTVGNVANTTQYDFTVALNDGFNPPVNRTFAIIVTPNALPIWTTNAGVIGSAFETAPLTVQISGYDPEGANVKYYLAAGYELPQGMLLTPTGTITGTMPSVAQDTDFSFNVYIDDGTPNTARRVARSFTLTSIFNSAPVWTTPAALGSVIESSNYSKQLSATGVGNGPMIYTLQSGTLPAGITLSSSGLLSGIMPSAASDAGYSFTVKAFNGIKSTNQTFTLTVAHNLAPVWNSNAGTIGSYFAGNNINVQLSATDPNGTPVTYALTNASTLPSNLSMTTAGLITGKLGIVANNTTYAFDVRVTDGVLSADRSFSVETLAQAAPNWITPAGELAQVFKSTYYSGFVQAADPQNLPITYSIVSGALPNGLTLNPSTGLIAGITPNVSSDTTYNFTIRATNGTKTSDRAFSFLVQSVATPSWTTPAGSLGSLLSGYGGSFFMQATDPQSLPLTYSLISGSIPAGMSFDPSSGGCYVQTHDNGRVPVSSTDQTYTFTVEVTNGFVPVQRTFSIQVLKNLVPVWVSPATGSLGTDNESAAVSVTFVATDPESQGIYFTVNSGTIPNGLSLNPNTGVLAGNLGSVSNTTTFNFVIDANDGRLTTPRSFSYTTQFSSPPTWVTGAGSLGSQLEQTPFTANVAATSDGQPIQYTVSNASTLPSGMSLNANTGAITGTLPPVSSDTTYSFDLVATSTVSNKSSTRTFSISVINDLPPVWSTPAGNIFTDLAGTSFSRTLTAIDPNGTPVSYVLANGVMPAGVTFDPNGAGHTAVVSGDLPLVGNNTTYSFTVGASDGASQVNRTFTFTSQLDTAPVWVTNAGSLGAAVTEGTIYTKTLVATDPNGRPVTYSLSNGTSLPLGLAMNSGGVISGTLPAIANALVNDVYNFDVTASDGSLTADRSFFITVKADALPVWSTPSGSIGTVLEGQTFSFPLVASDPEGNSLTYALANSTSLPTGFTLYANGVVSGRAVATPQDTTTNFEVRASDGVKFADRSFSLTVQFDATYYDPYSNSITLLMNFEDPANSSVITDWFDHPVTNLNNAVINSVDHVQYGNSAAYFDGTTQLTTPRLPDLNFPNQSVYTVEFWMYTLDINTTQYILSYDAASNDGNSNNTFWGIKKTNANLALRFGPGSTGTDPANIGTLTVGQWYHVAVVKNGGNIKTFFNGTLVANQSQAIIGSSATNLVIGSSFTGYMDDLRITNAARYTASFAPGPSPKPPKWISAANTVLATGLEGSVIANAVALDFLDVSGRNIKNFNATSGLPTGVTLDLSNGVLIGTQPENTGSNYTINIQGKDGNNNLTAIRPFTLVSNALSAPSSLQYSWRFNAQAGSTAFAPSVGNATPVAAGGGTASTAAAPAPFGTSTAMLFSNYSGLTFSHGTSMNFLTGANWTVEMWVNVADLTSAGSNRGILSIGGSASLPGNGFRWFNNAGGSLIAYLYDSTVVQFPAPTNGAWNHLALVRNGTTITAYTNGVAGTPITSALPAAGYFAGRDTAINGFVGQVGTYAYQTAYIRGLNMWSTSKYSDNFAPQWADYLSPIWDSNAALGSLYEESTFNTTVVATAFGNTAVTYSVANAGTMPAGFTLSSNGYVYGTVPAYTANTANSTFTLVGVDPVSRPTPPRTFTLTTISKAPTWVSNGLVGAGLMGGYASVQMVTTDPLGTSPITYSLVSGALPQGLTLSNSGLLSGTLGNTSGDVTNTFVVAATNPAGKSSNSTTLSFTTFVSADEDFANTAVLLHANGNFTDTANSLTWTAANGANASVQNSKFGSGAMYFPGTGGDATTVSYVRSSALSNSAKWNFANRDWTVEMWANVTNFVANPGDGGSQVTAILLQYGQAGSNNTNSMSFALGGTNGTGITNMSFQARDASGNVTNSGSPPPFPTPVAFNTWNHYAWTKQGNVIRMFLNGQYIASNQQNAPIVYSASYYWNIGSLLVSGTYIYPTKGYIDEFRITTDRARYTESFTPPSAPFGSFQDPSPQWVASNSVALASGYKSTPISIPLVTRDPNSQVVTYTNVTALPGSLTLVGNTITGTTANVATDTINTVVLRATNTSGYNADKTYKIVTYAQGDTAALLANTNLLIHAEDSANGGVIRDSRGIQTFTLNNGMAISNAAAKFGNSSIYFSGANTTIIAQSATDPAGLNFGSNDFTVEAWVNLTSLLSTQTAGQFRSTFFAVKPTAPTPVLWPWAFYAIGNTATNVTGLSFEGYASNGSAISSQTYSTSMALDTWHHVALSRTSGELKIFLNGVQPNAYANSRLGNTAVIPFPATSTLQLGGINYIGFTGNMKGYMDEVRITNGNARYTANFAVAVAPFPTVADSAPLFTSNTSLGGAGSLSNIAVQLAATDVNNLSITYSNSTALPGTLEVANGRLQGRLPDYQNNTVDSFTLRATNSNGLYSEKQFNFTTYAQDDLYYANVVTLIHAEDAANGGVIIDSRGLQTYTPRGVVASTADKKFGNSALYFNGTNGTVSTHSIMQSGINPPGLSNAVLGTNDFTMEAWCKFTGFTGWGSGTWSGSIMAVMANAIDNSMALNLVAHASGPTGPITNLQLTGFGTGGQPGGNVFDPTGTVTSAIQLNTWHHIAVTRNNGRLRKFVDGQMIGNTAISASVVLSTNPQIWFGGTYYPNYQYMMKGYMDDPRITTGVARYTDNFTVSAKTFGDVQQPVVTFANTSIYVQANSTVSNLLVANTNMNRAVTYTLVSGSLANGTTLLSNGLITGMVENVANVTNSVFVVSAQDSIVSETSNATITYTVGPYVDPYAANVIVLMPMTGTAGTLPVDLKGRPVSKDTAGFQGTTGTSGVGGYISAAQSKWGGGSMAVTQRASSLIIIGNSTTMATDQIGTTTDFAVEMWFYPNGLFTTSLSGVNMLFSTYNNSGYYLNINAAGNLEWRDTSVAMFTTSGGTLTQSQWHHIAVTRSGTTLRMFINGVQRASGSFSGGLGIAGQGATGFVIGHYQSSPNSPYGAVGYYNDVRITKGVPRYTANFTPPIGPIA